MKSTNRLRVCVLTLALALTACVPGGVRHGYFMRGQVLSVDGDVVSICIGSRDGAKVGEELGVERITPKALASPKSGGPTFERADIGRVKIVELFDEHYARAKVLAGAPVVHDVVELQR